MAARFHISLILAVLALVAVEGTLRTKPRMLVPRNHEHQLVGESGRLLGAPLAATNTAQNCNDQVASCIDCTNRLTCMKIAGSYQPVSTTACTGSTPYCVDGVCSATTTNSTCLQESNLVTDFNCLDDDTNGYFPSPANCRKYYYCADGQAYEYDCSQYGTTLYGPARAMCVPTSEATCNVATCTTATIRTYQKWRSDQSVYFVCTDTVAAHAYVADCGEDREIDASTGDCVLTCRREGRIADTSNKKQYYECIKTSATLETYVGPIASTCPGSSEFDAATERCVEGTGGGGSTPDADDEVENYFKTESDPALEKSLYTLPADLIIGAASAAYQVEGAWNVSDKSPSIWDAFFHQRRQQYPENGDVAADSYHRYLDDIEMLKQLGMKAYRFSMSWPRLLPNGDLSVQSEDGKNYYLNLIAALKDAGIEPIVTLHHWDIPNSFQQDDGGWLGDKIIDRFNVYADYAFQTFGSQVKYWLMMNEPHIFCSGGYETGGSAPGIAELGTGGYLCVHNMLLAHAKAWHNYNDNYKPLYGGLVGSSFDIQYAQPATNKPEDIEAAERSMIFGLAWVIDPFLKGDYPQLMKDVVAENSRQAGLAQSRLPSFTDDQKAMLKGALDFIGINHYTTVLVSAPVLPSTSTQQSYTNDVNVTSTSKASWVHSARYVFAVCPWGLRGTLQWITKRYGTSVPVFITENGYGGPADEGTDDPNRVFYYSTYLRALARSINEDKANVIGYTAWCLEDNLEWASGYSIKFGLVYVDYDGQTLNRQVKYSSKLFREVNGLTDPSKTHYVPYHDGYY
ncbi:Lactase-like protein [Frankliniella fusca]|uniref:Lactase-like protein n=1 Tax=Frankliniella fusca TaxID=407009 RepID=A0AAE1H599_9NEOP|nr:Lactase-like protein [Frankliniella fusca]